MAPPFLNPRDDQRVRNISRGKNGKDQRSLAFAHVFRCAWIPLNRAV